MRALAATMVMLLGSPAAAYEVTEVCATYDSTGARYRMEAQVMKGSELNRRARTYDFDYFATYALLWWAEGQVSIIQMDGIGAPSMFGSPGVDQEGREWTVSTSTTFCH